MAWLAQAYGAVAVQESVDIKVRVGVAQTAAAMHARDKTLVGPLLAALPPAQCAALALLAQG